MSDQTAVEYETNHTFDPARNRHYINGTCTVLHCHHYITLYSQLADAATLFDGRELLVRSAEETFYDVLNTYYVAKCIAGIGDKIRVAEDYWRVVGMGTIRFTGVGKFAVTAEMPHSHVDEGWLAKWGGRDRPVNFVTCGFVAAVAALANAKPPGSFDVKEIKSLVCGDGLCVFKGVLK